MVRIKCPCGSLLSILNHPVMEKLLNLTGCKRQHPDFFWFISIFYVNAIKDFLVR